MKILFNPEKGSDIANFIYNGVMLDPHPKGQLKQYEDRVAQELIDTFEFLEFVTPEQAQDILKKPKLEFKCELCDYASDKKIGLLGHMRGHKEAIQKAKEPAIDPNIIPVATGKKLTTANPLTAIEEDDLSNGTDKDGVEWYGEGLVEENLSFERIKPAGQGHFGGEALYDS